MKNIHYYYTSPDNKGKPIKNLSFFAIATYFMALVLLILVAGIVVFGWGIQDVITHDIDISHDIDLSKNPLQTPYKGENLNMNSKESIYTLTPVAIYEISAKAVSLRHYNDELGVSPIDICAVWGKMADEPDISYSQSERFCTYRYGNIPSFGEYYMLTHFSNNHILPASENVTNALNSIKVNDNVTLMGFLVDVKKENGYYWNTSQTRHDSGYGGCEIIYVTQVRAGNNVWK